MRRALTGYNHNVRLSGVVYHVQTEDNATRTEVVTDVFADGGRVIASRREGYASYDGDDLDGFVRALMQRQHKQLMVELRDGCLDGADPAPSDERETTEGARSFAERFADAEPFDEFIVELLKTTV